MRFCMALLHSLFLDWYFLNLEAPRQKLLLTPELLHERSRDPSLAQTLRTFIAQDDVFIGEQSATQTV
jgi:hypothetical protein